MSLQIHTIVSMPFAENTYVLWRNSDAFVTDAFVTDAFVTDAVVKDAVVIDPGLEPELILNFLAEHRLRPAVILNTHGHADHIAGNEALMQAFPQAPLIIGKDD